MGKVYMARQAPVEETKGACSLRAVGLIWPKHFLPLLHPFAICIAQDFLGQLVAGGGGLLGSEKPEVWVCWAPWARGCGSRDVALGRVAVSGVQAAWRATADGGVALQHQQLLTVWTLGARGAAADVGLVLVRLPQVLAPLAIFCWAVLSLWPSPSSARPMPSGQRATFPSHCSCISAMYWGRVQQPCRPPKPGPLPLPLASCTAYPAQHVLHSVPACTCAHTHACARAHTNISQGNC